MGFDQHFENVTVHLVFAMITTVLAIVFCSTFSRLLTNLAFTIIQRAQHFGAFVLPHFITQNSAIRRNSSTYVTNNHNTFENQTNENQEIPEFIPNYMDTLTPNPNTVHQISWDDGESHDASEKDDQMPQLKPRVRNYSSDESSIDADIDDETPLNSN